MVKLNGIIMIISSFYNYRRVDINEYTCRSTRLVASHNMNFGTHFAYII